MAWLTTETIEELQYLLPDRARIAKIVNGLTSATLPGIMEYGCLRWSSANVFPPLPEAISRSALGMVLQEVRSDLGLRMLGPPKRALHRAMCKELSFM